MRLFKAQTTSRATCRQDAAPQVTAWTLHPTTQGVDGRRDKLPKQPMLRPLYPLPVGLSALTLRPASCHPEVAPREAHTTHCPLRPRAKLQRTFQPVKAAQDSTLPCRPERFQASLTPKCGLSTDAFLPPAYCPSVSCRPQSGTHEKGCLSTKCGLSTESRRTHT